MENTQFEAYKFPKEKFEIVKDRNFADKKFDTKPIGYFKDALRRFCKNGASVVAAILIFFLILFSLVGTSISKYDVSFYDANVQLLLPKSNAFSWLGWDGCQKVTVNYKDYLKYRAIEKETGKTVIKKVYSSEFKTVGIGIKATVNKYYTIYLDSYTKAIMKYVPLTSDEYAALQAYQDEHKVQIIYPAVSQEDDLIGADANYWYSIYKYMPTGCDANTPEEDIVFVNKYIEDSTSLIDNYTSTMFVEGESKQYAYAIETQNGYKVRVDYNEYFAYLHGSEPCFLFGSDQYGHDIFGRLASGARFSLIFALCVSVINLTIGAIYGAIEGYFGGAADMIMERISDILADVPFMVVVTLFKLHIMAKVGVVVTLLFAYVMTGWIGMAHTTRMQFYRYKNQEYVLAARTLGASDFRIMFKHIFPNALGTLITSCVLVIPGVIFGESSLSYLGILNLSTGNTTSVGTLMANGQGYLETYPHVLLFPAIFIALLEITFNLFGNGLRDAFNPSLRGSED